MDNRIWSSGAAGTPPLIPASPSVGYPTSGNPALGILPTKGGAFWFHQIGEEFRNAIIAAGFTPSTADLTQLLQAIRFLIRESTTTYTTGGTATAFTLTPAPAITAYTANQSFDVVFHLACGAAATLTISGVATPPYLVRQLGNGAYENLLANAFPPGWQSKVKLVSATQALVLKLPKRIAQGSFTRDSSLASGTQSITGCGFRPAKVSFFAAVQSTLRASNGIGILNLGCSRVRISTGNEYVSVSPIYIQDGGADYYANITSFDSDGFTLTWTKLLSPTGIITVFFIAEEE